LIEKYGILGSLKICQVDNGLSDGKNVSYTAIALTLKNMDSLKTI